MVCPLFDSSLLSVWTRLLFYQFLVPDNLQEFHDFGKGVTERLSTQDSRILRRIFLERKRHTTEFSEPHCSGEEVSQIYQGCSNPACDDRTDLDQGMKPKDLFVPSRSAGNVTYGRCFYPAVV